MFFLWKQSIRHNLIERGFKKESVVTFLPLFDVLTVIGKEDIARGVEFIRERVQVDESFKGLRKNCLMSFWTTISSRLG
jgi:hypothetical protein